MMKMGEMVFPWQEQANWLSNQTFSPENIYTNNIKQTEKVLFIYLKTHTHILL